MALVHQNGAWFLSIRLFRKQIKIRTHATSKTEARRVEASLLLACKTGDYGSLDSVTREACIRMFQNQQWETPPALAGVQAAPREELTLWRACEVFAKYPETRTSPSLERYGYAISHLVERLGKETPVKSIWVPDIKLYQQERLSEGASPSTVNWEKATLSKMFQVLVELQFLDSNPVRLVKNLSQKSEERQAYLSLHDVHLIADRCPEWYQLVIWIAFYTGMRRGEIFSLSRKQISLAQQMIMLSPGDTKEGHWKRVPIHLELVPYLKEALRFPSLTSDKVFLVRDGRGIRAAGRDTVKNPWPRACESLEKEKLLSKPLPRFHDLRHTWRTNARRSGIDSQIAESILGHWNRTLGVNDRYGVISDEELVNAIDRLKFDFGPTTILVANGAGF